MLLDVGVGILLGVAFDALNGTHDLHVFLLIGVTGALAPDSDFIYHLIKGGTTKDDHRHREMLHNPLFLLVGWLILLIFTTPALAWLFAAGVLAHLVHDSIGIGWGVQWLAPFKTDHYTLFYRVHTANKPKPPKRLVYTWPNQQLDVLHRTHGDPDWFVNTYIKLHPYALFELGVFVLSLLVLALYLA